MKLHLKDLSSALLKFHRGLLQYQTELVIKEDQRSYSPYELLNLSLNDSRFSWLRKFSEIIVQIDTFVDDKKNMPLNIQELICVVKNLININSINSAELLQAIKTDASIMVPLAEIRKNILIIEKLFTPT